VRVWSCGERDFVGVVEDGIDLLGDEFLPRNDSDFGGGDDDTLDALGLRGRLENA